MGFLPLCKEVKLTDTVVDQILVNFSDIFAVLICPISEHPRWLQLALEHRLNKTK